MNGMRFRSLGSFQLKKRVHIENVGPLDRRLETLQSSESANTKGLCSSHVPKFSNASNDCLRKRTN